MTSSALFPEPSHEIWPERFSLSQVKVEAMIGLGLCGRRLPERGPRGTRLSVPRAWISAHLIYQPGEAGDRTSRGGRKRSVV